MDSLEVVQEIIDQFDDEISGQEALEFAADWSVTSGEGIKQAFTRHFTKSIFDIQKSKLWKSHRKTFHTDLVEATKDIIDEFNIKSSEPKSWIPSLFVYRKTANCQKKSCQDWVKNEFHIISSQLKSRYSIHRSFQGHPWPLWCKKVAKQPMDLVAERSVIIGQVCLRRRWRTWRSPSRQIGSVALAR